MKNQTAATKRFVSKFLSEIGAHKEKLVQEENEE
jgi:hypothetical protein